MDATEARSLKSGNDLLKKDLAGWQLIFCYYLELKHHCMGTFPAISVSDNVMILVTNKALLKKVWDRLPPRSAKVSKFTRCLVHIETGVTFLLESPYFYWNELYPLGVFSAEEIDSLDEVDWAPGLLAHDDHERITIPNFDA